MKTMNQLGETMNHFAKPTMLFSGAILTLAVILPMAATAGPITPTSYTYTAGTPAGDTPYLDSSMTKLTDGNIGTTNGSDGTWVDWQFGGAGADQITFLFGSSAT